MTETTELLLKVADVAEKLKCSVRNVHRLADAEEIPKPIKLGRLKRWSLAVIEQWIADGCPPCTKGGDA